jgi:hypothetical protein
MPYTAFSTVPSRNAIQAVDSFPHSEILILVSGFACSTGGVASKRADCGRVRVFQPTPPVQRGARAPQGDDENHLCIRLQFLLMTS